jgi:tetratricopeptide (TPR) repeat protein
MGTVTFFHRPMPARMEVREVKKGDRPHFLWTILLLLAFAHPSLAAGLQVADDPVSIARRAWQLEQAGDYAAAADAYRAFLRLRPDEAVVHSNLGTVLVKLGRYDEAIVEYQKAEKLATGDPSTGMNLALVYRKSGRVREAYDRFAKLHSKNPEEKQTTMLLAECGLQLGDYRRVIELLQPLERKDPADLATAYMLATALIREQRINEGRGLLDRIVRTGDSAEARFLLGTLSFESGDYPSAVKELARAIEINPGLPQLQTFYGLALLNTGDPEGAAAAFRAELEENPDEYAPNLALGQILIASKKYDQALPLIEKALLSQPGSIEAQLALGECLSGTGKLEEARKHLEAVTEAVPASLEAHRELLSVYTRLQMAPEAATERGRVSRLERDAAAMEGGPQIDSLAPDFKLPQLAREGQVQLSSFRGKTPVVLIFGSYSCPNFRSAADALNAWFQRYGRQVRFLLVYIREAHADGDWQSTRNVREGITVAPAGTMQDREEHALMCKRELHVNFDTLVDSMDGGAEAAYAAWPSRAFVIGRDGRIRYSTRLTQQDFRAEEMEEALQEAISGH